MTPGRDFRFVLALALGRTLWELFGDDSPARMSGAEFAAWKRFYGRHPFGCVRGDMQAGIVARAVFAGAGRRNLPSLADFVIVPRRRSDEGRVLKDQLRAIALVTGIPFTDGRNPDRQTGDRPPG